MPTADEDESGVCARCAQHSGTCCTLQSGQEELCFPLSAQERGRMEAAGANPVDFARQANTVAFVENLCRLFPGEAKIIIGLFPPNGEHDRLAIVQGGACALLGPKGCRLPRPARPLYCRLFPFWIRTQRELFFEFDQCEAQREAGGGASLLRRLGMTSESVRQTYSELRMAWGLPERK
jgi:Fe-S-cluster containining protein